MERNNDLIKQLENCKIENEQMLKQLEEQCKTIDDPQLIRSLFNVFENNSDYNFGNPGNLVRILEKFYLNPLYEQELYKSVERKPTEYNLWMLNRLLNSFEEQQKEKGIELLKTIVENEQIATTLSELAKEFLEEQAG